MASPKAPVLDAKGGKGKEVSLEAAIFGGEVKPHLVHEAVRAEQNSHRAGTFASKSRGLVSGGRSKPNKLNVVPLTSPATATPAKNRLQ